MKFNPSEFLCLNGVEGHVDSEGVVLAYVSVHAITNIYNYMTILKTMSISRPVKGKAIKILIDTGSTPNFIDLETAKRSGCYLTQTQPFSVSVADGNKMHSGSMCKGFEWKMQGVQFLSDMLIVVGY